MNQEYQETQRQIVLFGTLSIIIVLNLVINVKISYRHPFVTQLITLFLLTQNCPVISCIIATPV